MTTRYHRISGRPIPTYHTEPVFCAVAFIFWVLIRLSFSVRCSTRGCIHDAGGFFLRTGHNHRGRVCENLARGPPVQEAPPPGTRLDGLPGGATASVQTRPAPRGWRRAASGSTARARPRSTPYAAASAGGDRIRWTIAPRPPADRRGRWHSPETGSWSGGEGS